MVDKQDSYRWVMLMLTWIVGLALATPMYSCPPLLSDISLDMNMSTSEAALLMSLPTLTFTSFHAVGGFSADRFGTKKTMSIGLSILSASTLLSAYANSAILEEAARLIIGAGIGMTGVCVIKTLSNWFPQSELSLAVGVQATGWAAGNAVGLFSPVFLKQLLGIGWRGPFYAFGVLACITTLIFIFLARERTALSVASNADMKEAITSILVVKEFWYLTIAQLGFIACNTAILTWLPTALMGSGWSSETSALATTVIPLMGIVSNVVGGVVSNKLGRRKPIILISGISVSLAAATLGVAIPGPIVWPALSVLGWFSYFFTAPFFATPSALPEVGLGRVGTLVGLMMLLSSVGGFVSPVLVGALKESTGSFTPGFLLSACFAASLILPGLLGRETGSRT